VHEAHEELRGGVSCIGERAPLAVGARVVGAAVSAAAVLEAGVGDTGDRQERDRGERESRAPSAYFQRTCTLTFGYSGTPLTYRPASMRILLGAGGRR
jgi:hypothetical protein